MNMNEYVYTAATVYVDIYICIDMCVRENIVSVHICSTVYMLCICSVYAVYTLCIHCVYCM